MAKKPQTLPISLVLRGRACLVVGGGNLALRRLRTLAEGEATCTVIAPEVSAAITALGVHIQRRHYVPGDAARFDLVFAATGDRSIDAAVGADALQAKVLVNVADNPAVSSFFMPAVARHGSVSIAVGSDGSAPALASWLRNELSRVAEPEATLLAPLLGAIRDALQEHGVSTEGHDWHGLIGELRAIAARQGEADAHAHAEDVTKRWIDDGS